jgi:hypothetical protein
MNNPTDDAAIIRAFLASNLLWQARLNALPLLVAEPEQIPAHEFHPLAQNESISYCPSKGINEF